METTDHMSRVLLASCFMLSFTTTPIERKESLQSGHMVTFPTPNSVMLCCKHARPSIKAQGEPYNGYDGTVAQRSAQDGGGPKD